MANPLLPVLPTVISNGSRYVAVIGAGPAGLVAARELRREGHRAVVFERQDQIGGTWVYTPQVESDSLSLDPNRNIVISSLYDSLRTNIPREVMGFLDYPFVSNPDDPLRDQRRYPAHKEVLMYLKDFAREFGIMELVRLGTEVLRVGLTKEGKWKVRSIQRGYDVEDEDAAVDEIFDAVVVCNGHYTEPRLAEIPGINAWPGKQLHSHNYRIPDPFRDQVVILIGNAISGIDISRDIATVAKEVHIVSRSPAEEELGKQLGHDNIWLHSMIISANENGTVAFQDGTAVDADVIMHCTGYKFHFPFLETNGILYVDDNRVGPLYKHVFPPVLAPWLSFVGLPWKVVPFPMDELQSKWIAGVLSGRIVLPSHGEMMEDVQTFYSSLADSNIPKRYTHRLIKSQFEYNNWLAAQCGCPGIEEWRMKMHDLGTENRRTRPETYRDEWDDQDLIREAHEDFIRYTSN